MAQGSEPEQRMDGGEARVAGAGADMADDLQVIEEGADVAGVEVGEVEARRLDSRGLLEVAEQEPVERRDRRRRCSGWTVAARGVR